MSTRAGKIEFANIDPKILIRNPEQNRVLFDESKLYELAESIRNHGQKQPIDVAKHPQREEYYIVAGERRTRAKLLIASQDLESGESKEDEDYYKILAQVQYPETMEEFKRILIVDMSNENNQSEGISPMENGVFFREKLRVKTLAGRPHYDFATITNLSENLLGFIGKKKLNDIENKVLSSNIKSISKMIRLAYTTHEIEDEIELNNGIDDRFLMYHIARLGKALGVESLSFGKNRKKERDLYYEFKTLSKEEMSALNEQEEISYQNQLFLRKKMGLMNETYSALVNLIFDGEYSLDDAGSYKSWQDIVVEKVDAAIDMTIGIKALSKPKKKSYKTLGTTSYERSKKSCKLTIDFSKVRNKEKYDYLVNQLLALMESEEKQAPNSKEGVKED